MKAPEKNIKFKHFGSLFLDDKILFQNVLFFLCFDDETVAKA